jgi:hypothetical protein
MHPRDIGMLLFILGVVAGYGYTALRALEQALGF